MSMTLTKEILLKYKKDASVFVETGTYRGSTIQLALDCGFKKVYSIDISRKYEQIHIDDYKNQIQSKVVDIRYGDSIEILPDIINEVKKEKVVFWLDSHYDENSDTEGLLIAPVLTELCYIKLGMTISPVIMVDDIRMFGIPSTWGENIKIRDVFYRLLQINPNYSFHIEDGYQYCDILISL